MSSFVDLPCVFRLARLHCGKDALTYDEYLFYLGIWRDMSDSAQDIVRRIVF
jgi:hypothetical protein